MSSSADSSSSSSSNVLQEQLISLGYHVSIKFISEIDDVESPSIVDILTDKLLNYDMRKNSYFLPSLPIDLTDLMTVSKDFQLVLQISSVLDVTQPEQYRNKQHEDKSSNNRLLKLKLSDGFTTLSAIEMQRLPELSVHTLPGTKLVLRGPVQVAGGKLLLGPDCCCLLGGQVAHLAEAFIINKSTSNQRAFVTSQEPPKFQLNILSSSWSPPPPQPVKSAHPPMDGLLDKEVVVAQGQAEGSVSVIVSHNRHPNPCDPSHPQPLDSSKGQDRPEEEVVTPSSSYVPQRREGSAGFTRGGGRGGGRRGGRDVDTMPVAATAARVSPPQPPPPAVEPNTDFPAAVGTGVGVWAGRLVSAAVMVQELWPSLPQASVSRQHHHATSTGSYISGAAAGGGAGNHKPASDVHRVIVAASSAPRTAAATVAPREMTLADFGVKHVKDKSSGGGGGVNRNKVLKDWECGVCTFRNNGMLAVCEMCDTRRTG